MNVVTYEILGGDFDGGGAGSRAVKEQLKKIGADPAVVRRAMVAAYEAEMNVVIHAHRGRMHATLNEDQLRVEVIDEGPGIPDIEQAMRPGFSTASAQARELGFGAGLGLPNIRRNSDTFDIESRVGHGTRVCFTLFLKAPALYGTGTHSVRTDPQRCRECFDCVYVCPTAAVRVFRGRPEILDYLCIDCTACIGVCPAGALLVAPTGAFAPTADGLFIVPPALFVQFGDGVSAARIRAELTALGCGEVRSLETWESALQAAVVEFALQEAKVLPVISPACPAVTNLIEMRYPSLLPHVAPFLSPVEAAWTQCDGRRTDFVVCCPAQRTTLLAAVGDAPRPGVLLPAAVRGALLPRLHAARADGPTPSTARGSTATDRPNLLRVTGLRHVISVLEQIENERVGDVAVLDPWACDEGCFGSSLWTEEPFLARYRWRPETEPQKPAGAVRRTNPRLPRPGLRLDEDMAKAIQKLARIDKLARELPGRNCHMCGAPSCAALAEDIVRGRATLDACAHPSRDAEVRGPAAPSDGRPDRSAPPDLHHHSPPAQGPAPMNHDAPEARRRNDHTGQIGQERSS